MRLNPYFTDMKSGQEICSSTTRKEEKYKKDMSENFTNGTTIESGFFSPKKVQFTSFTHSKVTHVWYLWVRRFARGWNGMKVLGIRPNNSYETETVWIINKFISSFFASVGGGWKPIWIDFFLHLNAFVDLQMKQLFGRRIIITWDCSFGPLSPDT